MIPFTNSSIKSGRDRRSELIALSFSVLFSIIFLTSFTLFYKRQPRILIPSNPLSVPTGRVEGAQLPTPPEPNEKFRVVPDNFADVDFENLSYGPYTFGDKKLVLTLSQGEHETPFKEGGGGETFRLSEVFYTDLTGDGKPEAIVMLSHVVCGGSCDGGSDLFYIYENRRGALRKIWEYETGSMAYGCGLKSFTVMNEELSLEMFGHCWEPASSFELSGKFIVRDLTRAVFHYNGRRFVKKLTEVTASPAKDLRNYTPEVHIEN